MTRKALGRGLEALIPKRLPDVEPAPPVAAATLDVPDVDSAPRDIAIERIAANPMQPRTSFDPQALDELAASVRENGILQPLLVRRRGNDYELVAGERRLRAARIAGLSRVPVFVRDLDEEELLRLAILENVQRQDLNPIDEARGYQRLLDEFGMSQQEVAAQLGKSRSAVANTVRLLALPRELQEQVERGDLTSGHARALLSAETLEEQTRIAQLVREQGLTVRDVERIAQSQPTAKKRQATARVENPAVAELQRRLEARVGTRVRIRSKKADGSAGRVEIDYYQLADLERIFEIAGVEYLL